MAQITAVYLSNESLQAVTGKTGRNHMKISQGYHFPFDEGAIINGVITDEAPIKTALRKLLDCKVKQVHLVIDSGLILLKNAVVPQMGKRHMLTLVKNELSSIEGENADLLYDYSVIRAQQASGSGREILCCAVERKMIGSYIDLFSSVGIKLLSIDVSINSVGKLMRYLPEFAGKTYILAVLDGNNLLSFLFEDGHYKFSSRARLFAERGSQALGAELAEKISSMIQFGKYQSLRSPVEHAYLCGLHSGEALLCAQVSSTLGIDVMNLPASRSITARLKSGSFSLAHDLFPVGCLIRK